MRVFTKLCFVLALTQCPTWVSHLIKILPTVCSQSFVGSSMSNETGVGAVLFPAKSSPSWPQTCTCHISSIVWCHAADKSDSQAAFKSFFGSTFCQSALRGMESAQVLGKQTCKTKLLIPIPSFICDLGDEDRFVQKTQIRHTKQVRYKYCGYNSSISQYCLNYILDTILPDTLFLLRQLKQFQTKPKESHCSSPSNPQYIFLSIWMNDSITHS